MAPSTTQRNGEELNQLSRLLFDRASNLWVGSLILEIVGGVAGISVALMALSENAKFIFAFVVFIIVAIAYALRMFFEFVYDDAETMRRQSVLTESLEWPIGPTQFSEWRRKAGDKILKTFRLKARDEDYYATQKPVGSRRLLEMTIESAFFTRYIYRKIRNWIWFFFSIIAILSVVALTITPLESVQAVTHLQIVYILYLALPIIISIDLLGWAIRLGRLSSSIKEIECGLEELEKKADPAVEQVLRLVSEYNCQVIAGFPVPNVLFRYWHDSINEHWKLREKTGWGQ